MKINEVDGGSQKMLKFNLVVIRGSQRYSWTHTRNRIAAAVLKV